MKERSVPAMTLAGKMCWQTNGDATAEPEGHATLRHDRELSGNPLLRLRPAGDLGAITSYFGIPLVQRSHALEAAAICAQSHALHATLLCRQIIPLRESEEALQIWPSNGRARHAPLRVRGVLLRSLSVPPDRIPPSTGAGSSRLGCLGM
jgi:hypothetical protein